jgi:putative peptide zinc metalloprotease protein
LNILRRGDLQAESLLVRGQRWWRIKDPLRLHFWQFGDEEYFLWSQLEGGVSLAELQQRFQRRFAPRRIELPQLHQFLGTLHREGLVFSTTGGQADVLLEREDRQRAMRRVQWLTNLLAIRFRGVNPTRFLEWLYPRVAWLFGPWFLAACSILVLSALLLAVVEANQILARLPRAQEFLTPGNLVWLAATLAAVKVGHELGHALTCRHLGGRCHELGVMLLVFTPCLYCNVSDAWLLPSRWRRMAISAAGMGVEWTLAAAATWLWWFSEPGLFSTLCLNGMVICSLNTLLFNGNPLLRFDGYFLLSDALDLPNLRQAGDEWLRDRAGHLIFGNSDPQGSSLAHDRRLLVAAYGSASFCYRWCLTVVIWWLVYHWLAELGLAIVGTGVVFVSAVAMVGQAAWNGWETWSAAWRERRVRRGRATLSLTAAVAVLAVIALLPLPRSVTAPVTIRPADAATVYVTRPGTMLQAVEPGSRVESGEPLAQLQDSRVEQELLRLSGERDVLRRQIESLTRQQVHDLRTGVASAAGQLRTVEQQLADVLARLDQKLADREELTIRSPRGGIVLAPRSVSTLRHPDELRQWEGSPLEARNRGCFLEPGNVLCLVGEPGRREALVVVDQSEIDQIRTGQVVVVQLDELPLANLQGSVASIAELSTTSVPPEFAARGLLPVAVEGGEPRLLQTCYEVTVSLPAGRPVPLGAAGRAKIRVKSQPLAGRLYEALCRTFRW